MALGIKPGNPKIWKMLGDAYNHGFSLRQATVQNKPSAIDYYRQATRLDPKNAAYWDAIGGTYECNDDMLQPDFYAPPSMFLAMIQYARNAIAAYKASSGIKVNYDTLHTIAYLESQIKSWQESYIILQQRQLEAQLLKQKQSKKHG